MTYESIQRFENSTMSTGFTSEMPTSQSQATAHESSFDLSVGHSNSERFCMADLTDCRRRYPFACVWEKTSASKLRRTVENFGFRCSCDIRAITTIAIRYKRDFA